LADLIGLRVAPPVGRFSAMQSLQDAVDQEVERTGFSGVVRLDRSGETEICTAYGYADRAHGVSNTVETLFATASGSPTTTPAMSCSHCWPNGRAEWTSTSWFAAQSAVAWEPNVCVVVDRGLGSLTLVRLAEVHLVVGVVPATDRADKPDEPHAILLHHQYARLYDSRKSVPHGHAAECPLVPN